MALGQPDVDALLDSLTPEQFNEWIAFECLEGINEGWRQTGEICVTLANTLGGEAAKKLKAEDFIPRHRLDKQHRKKTTISAQDDEAAAAAQYGGK